MARLGDVATYINGYAFKPADWSDIGLPIIRIQDLTGNAYQANRYSGPYDSKYEVVDGDVLISWSASLGVYVWHGGTALLNQHIFKVVFDKCDVDKRFFIHQVKAILGKASSAAHGATMKHLTKPVFDSLPFYLPSVEEQKEIAERLDVVCTLIEYHKQQLAKLDELVKSRFIELFGATGKQVPLTDYVWFQEGPGVRSIDFTDDGTILLTGSNINDNEISFGYKSDRHIANELASGKYAHFMCDKDDILVVSSAIDPDKFDKKVVVVDVDKKYCLNTGIIRFKPNKQYLTLGYFREFLKTDYFKHQVSSEMRGIAQMHFGPSHLKQMTILLPDSLEGQIEFEAFVQQIDKSKLAIQQSLAKLETLKKSLMQEYFG